MKWTRNRAEWAVTWFLLGGTFLLCCGVMFRYFHWEDKVIELFNRQTEVRANGPTD